jgi:hypothetical protein
MLVWVYVLVAVLAHSKQDGDPITDPDAHQKSNYVHHSIKGVAVSAGGVLVSLSGLLLMGMGMGMGMGIDSAG